MKLPLTVRLVSFILLPLIILSAGLVLIVDQGKNYRILASYETSRRVSALWEYYMVTGALPDSFPEAQDDGFAVIDKSGKILVSAGDIPKIEDFPATENLEVIKSRVFYYKPSGKGAGKRQKQNSGSGSRHDTLIYYGGGVETLFGTYLFRYFLVGLLMVVLLGLIFLSYHFLTRLLVYRQQEEQNKVILQLGEASRTLTHEIRNPLAVMKTQLAILKKKSGENADILKNLDILNSENDRIARLTERVREYLSNPKGHPTLIALHDFLKDIAEIRQIVFDSDIEDTEKNKNVLMDRDHLYSTITNLIINAEESGDDERDNTVEISLQKNRQMFEILVCDKGRGIDKDSDVFKPFSTSKVKGLGMGLSLCRNFVEAAGGTIYHTGRKEGGTCFHVLLERVK